MPDYGDGYLADELVEALFRASVIFTFTQCSSLSEAIDAIRIDGELYLNLAQRVKSYVDQRYSIPEDASTRTAYVEGLTDVFVLGTMFGALVGAEQELKVVAVAEDDGGRTIKTPKARLRHNDPRLRRNRRGR